MYKKDAVKQSKTDKDIRFTTNNNLQEKQSDIIAKSQSNVTP